MPYSEMDSTTRNKLALLSQRARAEPRLRFTSLAHLLNEGFLRECYHRLGRDRACGIDGVSWKDYGERLEEHLTDLVSRLKAKRYKGPPTRNPALGTPRRSLPGGCTSRRTSTRSDRWVCRPWRIRSCRKGSPRFWRRSTSRIFWTARTAFVRAAVVIRLWPWCTRRSPADRFTT